MRWYLSDPTYLQIISSPFHQASRDANESAIKLVWLLSGSRKFPAYLHPEMGRIVKWPSSRPLWVGSVAIQMFSNQEILQHDFTTWKDVYVYKWRFPKVGVSLNHPFSIGIFHERNHPPIGVPLWLCMEAPKCHWPFQYQLPSNILWEKRASWWVFVGYTIYCIIYSLVA